MSQNHAAAVKRLESQVAWWHEQARQIDRDRAMLRYVLPVGLVAGSIGLYFEPLVGCGILATALVAWGMGLYMTTVRRFEFRDNLREAQADLAEVEAQGPEPETTPASVKA